MNFYREAAQIVDKLENKKGSIKSLISTIDEHRRRRTAALVIESLKYRPALLKVIETSGLLKTEKKYITSPNLAVVLVHDLLLSKGIEASDGVLKQAILRHKTRLQAEWTLLKVKKGTRSNEELAQPEDSRARFIPRYVRINTNLWTVEGALKILATQNFELREWDSRQSLVGKEFCRDQHIQDLLIFPHSQSFKDNEFYNAGKLILQDKASCFPAAVLNPPKNGAVIDATSAPGNKTSHLSALMQNTGKIYAFERDQRRFKTLQSMVAKAGCKNVEPIHADFLSVNPREERFKIVTHILLDPSCSGSGIVNRLDYLTEAEEANEGANMERLKKLSSFQLAMIKHAMKFPGLCKLVYSTCSIHPEENEHVVQQAIQSPECRSGEFKLASPSQVLPAWHRRGLTDQLGNEAESLVRCSPGEDGTNGFFVSCFVKQGSIYDVSGPNKAALKMTASGNASAGHPGIVGGDRKRKAHHDDAVMGNASYLGQEASLVQPRSPKTNSVSNKPDGVLRPKKKHRTKKKRNMNCELKSEISEFDQLGEEAIWAGIE
ncbi:hypothetical protein FRC02_001735 [Tulasnella sp. 418]|nr:hypothetical protein FRC02_001735 [Tulasnella sp. 418]